MLSQIAKQLEHCKFRCQYSVWEFVVDFFCAELKLAIEVDGESHFQAGVPEYDAERQALIELLGVRFLRFTNAEVYNDLEGVLERIREVVKELRNPPCLRHPPLLRGDRGGSRLGGGWLVVVSNG